MSPLNTGRGQHGCTWHRGSIVVGGGWSSNEDPNYPGQIPTKSVETYSVLDDVWTESVPLRHRRTLFGFTSLNGTLAALGGWEGDFLDTIELFDAESQGWEYAPGYLAQKKSAFAMVETSSFFQDVECTD
ncbi:kelch-like ECH-associated protein 1 [Eurytemora carolleeae]|uniref:kelch-like ECH-associated protein 1 n=1 Tax=Eurytemora carolleeae TaxID=1294199 RepID=UPI000C75CA63|nr:kelch-like ECH-associated protein 1 [Eurytemora carolleeae]|eukprot:XP_023337824.1 kelch-like ECH-associated protein 1 [Eurytemora affinis]